MGTWRDSDCRMARSKQNSLVNLTRDGERGTEKKGITISVIMLLSKATEN